MRPVAGGPDLDHRSGRSARWPVHPRHGLRAHAEARFGELALETHDASGPFDEGIDARRSGVSVGLVEEARQFAPGAGLGGDLRSAHGAGVDIGCSEYGLDYL